MIASENAARNILVVGGHTETKNGQVGQYNPDSPLLDIKLIDFTNLSPRILSLKPL